MKDQVAMSPNGELCVLIPLYRMWHEEPIAKLDGYSVSLSNEKPLAYVLDSLLGCILVNADFVEKSGNLTILGDL